MTDVWSNDMAVGKISRLKPMLPVLNIVMSGTSGLCRELLE